MFEGEVIAKAIDNVAKAINKKNVPDKIIQSLNKIIDMYWPVEYKDWEELENPDSHIFHQFNDVKNWLVSQKEANKEDNNGTRVV
tara:strand:+ start:10600 stop:10854 length:255 start_codon:yes stop_codon:yes gene_type:complete